MNLVKTVLCISFVICSASCDTVEQRKDRTDLDNVVDKHVSLSRDMTKSTAYVGKHLEGLDDKQMASVAGLIMLTRVATLNETANYYRDTNLSREF